MNMEWIKTSDRLPTEEDATKLGEVLVGLCPYYDSVGVAQWYEVQDNFIVWCKIELPNE